MIITHLSYKGCTGKTTLNTLTATTLAKKGFKTLMIDLDPSCCLSQIYHKELSDVTSKDLISGSKVEPYHTAENLDLIPSSLDMALLQNIMDSTLKNMLKKFKYVEDYDYIIIDPPGNWNSHTRNAIFAADILIVTGTISSLVFVVCNKFNNAKNEPEIFEKYQTEFKEYLIKNPISDIKSLKYLTSNPDYPLHPAVKKRLDDYVQEIIKTEV